MEGGLDSLFLTGYEQLGWEQTDPALWEPEPLVGGRIPALPSPPKLSLNLEAFGIPDADFPLLTIPLYTSTADSSHVSAGERLDAEGATSSLAAAGAEGPGRGKRVDSSKNAENSSLPTEPKDQKKKIRRRLSNRESARRSRARRQSQLDTLEVQVAELRVSNAALLKKAQDAAQGLAEHSKNNEAMREEIAMLRQTLDEWTRRGGHVEELKEVESVRVKEEV
ncbi:Putative basic region leucin zipper-containing protein [Klebsormidium nitens]|uniref:Putative basic region leucin zipper-containing protein n=1 Tax=Klebsormidium nitens TaxID=105231 RepID=A0A1Y1IBC3_KLENI|nr:Putative basic region leucin zipper-containing protein [Klebsormidium nitens]|eukprot:GAQ87262.1 Putative basic region leucin zipper-containing protein [Klebsormidium nitens]